MEKSRILLFHFRSQSYASYQLSYAAFRPVYLPLAAQRNYDSARGTMRNTVQRATTAQLIRVRVSCYRPPQSNRRTVFRVIAREFAYEA